MNIEYARGIARRYGVPAALHDLAYRAANRVTKFSVLRGMSLTMSSLDPKYLERGGAGAWGFIDRDRLVERVRSQETEMTLSFVEEALSRGDRCFGMLDGETLASYGWYSSRPTPIDDGLVLHFDPAYAYMYSGFTLPAYRGQRLHGIGMAGAAEALVAEGQRGLVSYVRANNFASLRSCARMGYRVFGDILVAKLGERHVIHASSGCRAFDFRVERSGV